MARQTECEHNIDFYRVVAGSGLSVTEQCSECGAQINSFSPRQKIENELKEEEKEERKQKAAARKRNATIAAKKEVEEEDEGEGIEEKFKAYFDK